MNRRGFLRSLASAAVAVVAAPAVVEAASTFTPTMTGFSGVPAGEAINVLVYGGSRGGGKTWAIAHVLSKHPGPVYVHCTSDAQREHWRGMLFDMEKQECREIPVKVVRRVDL
jgi:hypothetical protein